VLASNPKGVAVHVDGVAEFSRSGLVKVKPPALTFVDSVTVTGVALSESSLILATMQDYLKGAAVAGVVADARRSSFTIYLTALLSVPFRIAWFVIG
jgi:hypothetical protein